MQWETRHEGVALDHGWYLTHSSSTFTVAERVLLPHSPPLLHPLYFFDTASLFHKSMYEISYVEDIAGFVLFSR